jgi:hypothetical protein
MNKLKTKWVSKWAKKCDIDDENLLLAIDNLKDNLSSSSLGAGLFKVRVPSKNSGKSGGFRTLIVYKENQRAVVIYGFSKNEQENLSNSELLAFKTLSKDILKQSEDDLKIAIENGIFLPLGDNL